MVQAGQGGQRETRYFPALLRLLVLGRILGIVAVLVAVFASMAISALLKPFADSVQMIGPHGATLSLADVIALGTLGAVAIPVIPVILAILAILATT